MLQNYHPGGGPDINNLHLRDACPTVAVLLYLEAVGEGERHPDEHEALEKVGRERHHEHVRADESHLPQDKNDTEATVRPGSSGGVQRRGEAVCPQRAGHKNKCSSNKYTIVLRCEVD